MVSEVKTKIYKTKGRHYLYLPKNLITDSNFPLDLDCKVVVRIKDNSLIIQNLGE